MLFFFTKYTIVMLTTLILTLTFLLGEIHASRATLRMGPT